MVLTDWTGPGHVNDLWREEFVLLDRRTERAAIDRVLDAVRSGFSGALVLRGGRKTPNSAVAVPELIRQGWMILDQREPEHFAAARAAGADRSGAQRRQRQWLRRYRQAGVQCREK